MTKDYVKATVRAYIAQEFLDGESPDTIEEDTEFVSGGILDSLASLRLVAFLEERFGIEVAAHEVDVENLDTLETIAALVLSKKS